MNEPKGLYGKYIIYPAEALGRLDEYRPIEDAFVLRPGKDHIAREALAHYATRTPNADLRSDLWEWLYRLEASGLNG